MDPTFDVSRRKLHVKDHVFVMSTTTEGVWSCIHCGLIQVDVIQEASFGWCNRGQRP